MTIENVMNENEISFIGDIEMPQESIEATMFTYGGCSFHGGCAA